SRLLLVLLLVSSLFLITLDLRGVNLAGGIRGSVASALSPVEKLFSNLFSPIGNLVGDIRNLGQADEKIEKLSKELDQLKSKEIIDEDIVGQLSQLRNVLDLAGRADYKIVAARVINRGSSATFKETITIDVGSSSGISKNMTVISDGGLVGVVKSVSSSTSIVMLMSDPTFKIGVRIAGTQSIGVLSGKGGNTYLLQLLDATGEIKVGDKLVARGSEGGRPFVPGVPVGTVIEVQSNSSAITQNADVQASANLNQIGIVAVVVSPPKGDPRDSLIPKPNPTVTVYVTPTPTPSPTK
ncbi:MAG: rod shape-determining protein MreC, partial [Actinobacteria bacterium]|nr:rod shape-determining protein MreC [Actinomycetota bacterium]